GGIVYNAAYLRFREAGRAEAIRATGAPYTMLLEQGLQLPVVELNVRYRNPAFYDDVLGVFVSVAELRRVQVSFAYELRRESDGRLLATARTDHACLDIEHGRAVPIPAWGRAGLPSLSPGAERP